MLSLHIDAKALLGGEAVAITLDEDVHATEATPGASDGGFVQATPAPPQGIAAMRLYEVWNALGRYKPVAAVLAALVVAAIVLPGVRVIENAASPYASAVDTSAAHPAAPTEDDSVTPADGAAAAGDTEATDADATLPAGTVDLAASPAVTPVSSTAATTASGTGPTATASPTEPVVASPTTSATLGETRTDPTFKVRELGWATAQAGNPVATAGIPEGGMPVGKRLGEVDKISFVRLSGSSSVLTLHVVEDPTATRLADSAGVRACRITESSWKAQTGVALDQAPSYDKSACAVGRAGDDGTWTFDLRAFDDAADARGFALVPTADAASDFQVVFAQT
jgi:hypothetical protein